MPHKVWIHWGGPVEEIQCYKEETLAELNAFLSGVSAAIDAFGHDDVRQFDTEEELAAFLAEEGDDASRR
jgi:hypothetical protein